MERYYQFAGVEIAVEMPAGRWYQQEGALAAFAVERVCQPHRFHFSLVESLPPPMGACERQLPGACIYRQGEWTLRYLGSVEKSWSNAYICVMECGSTHNVLLLKEKYPDRIGGKTVLNVLDVEHLLAQNSAVLLHCAYICRKDRAILFTAPSGTGKSTQAELWHRLRGAEIINGDRAALGIVEGRAMALGVPFSGSSRYCKNRFLPLEAIVYLAQASETQIKGLRGYEAFRRVWEGCSAHTWKAEDMSLVSGTVKRCVETVPVFRLDCVPDESAVLALEQALERQALL